jgi:hypothetical protein
VLYLLFVCESVGGQMRDTDGPVAGTYADPDASILAVCLQSKITSLLPTVNGFTFSTLASLSFNEIEASSDVQVGGGTRTELM